MFNNSLLKITEDIAEETSEDIAEETSEDSSDPDIVHFSNSDLPTYPDLVQTGHV